VHRARRARGSLQALHRRHRQRRVLPDRRLVRRLHRHAVRRHAQRTDRHPGRPGAAGRCWARS
jgi:hypothetical protein